jgi:iron complex outermembrane receptor protein
MSGKTATRCRCCGWLVTALGLCSLFAAFVAQAQEEELQEIMVTAQRQEEPLQAVPGSVAVLSGNDVVARGLSDLGSLTTQIAGLQMSLPPAQGNTTQDFYIRGIGQNDFIDTNDPGVGVYLDGVFIDRTAAGLTDLTDINDVEVLRGPQGTLFGKDTIGGAILVQTKKPDLNATSGEAFVREGERSREDAGITLNVPVVEGTFALRFNFLTKNQKGYGESLETGQLYGGQGEDMARIGALWVPIESLHVDFSSDWTQIRQPDAFVIVTALNPNTFITIPQNQWATANGVAPYDDRWLPPGLYKNYAVTNPGDHEESFGNNLTITWDLPESLQFKSISAYRTAHVETGLAYSGAPSQIGDQRVWNSNDQISQEFTLSGKSFANQLNWVAGLYYLREDIYNDIYLPLSFPANPSGYDTYSYNSGTTDSYAGYAQATYKITDQWSFVAGVRESDDRKADTITVYADKFSAYLVPATPLEHSWSSFTYRVGLQYQFDPDVMAYSTVSTGFKSGGFNGRAQSLTYIAFNPEKATTYEVGLKSELLEHRIRLNVDAYLTNYNDIQTTLNVVDPVTMVETNVVANPADARIKGLELDSQYILTKYLTANIGLEDTSAHYTHLLPGTTGVSLSGHLPEVPVWSGTFGLQLNVPAPSGIATDGLFTARIDESHKASYFDGTPNTAYNYEPPVDVVNARLAYGPQSGKWQVAAYARNLMNHPYYLSHTDLYAFLYSVAYPAPPRELGGEVWFRW